MTSQVWVPAPSISLRVSFDPVWGNLVAADVRQRIDAFAQDLAELGAVEIVVNFGDGTSTVIKTLPHEE